MPAARAFGVKGVDVAPLEGGDCVLDKARLVQRIGVDRDRNIELLGDGSPEGALEWPALLRKLDILSPSYRD